MPPYSDVESLIRAAAPERATACVRPHRVHAATAWFAEHFPGRVLYAVKANASAWALDTVHGAGIDGFDVASPDEFDAIAHLPGAETAFMHPIKSPRAIAEAYVERGCRVFTLDHARELEKISRATGGARDVTLIVRLTVDNGDAVLPLHGKFGVGGAEAVALLAAARRSAERLGVAFHVGSQCMNPGGFRRAMAEVGALIAKAGVTVDVIDVGGGFPSLYPGLTPPPMDAYVAAIADAFAASPVHGTAELWCEPGRALVAEGESILTRIELRKGDALYINDGAFGHLYDAAHEKWRFPARLIRPGGVTTAEPAAFQLWGPTCDASDHMPGPFFLPADAREGDYVEIGLVGAYGRAMRSAFNGFGLFDEARVDDDPFPSLFTDEPPAKNRHGATASRSG